MKRFSQWTIADVETEFQVRQVENSPMLEAWLTTMGELTDFEREQLQRLQRLLNRRVYDWNEQELIAHFIGPLLVMVDFDQAEYASFMERELAVSYHKGTLSGIVYFVVAHGQRMPERPYFFIHEYKREQEASGDPLGQLLITMVAAQLLNQDDNPIYGAYVMGRYWHFTVLHEKTYSVHAGFNAAREEIESIYRTLQHTKTLIERMIAPSNRIA